MQLRAPFPEDYCVEVEHELVVARFTIPEDYRYFDGHFPGNPLVPAVVQIGWATTLVEAITGEPVSDFRLSRFKFAAPIRPLDKIEICVKMIERKFTCRYYSNGELCSSGSITLIDHV